MRITILLITLSLIMLSCGFAEKEKHFLPDGYIGEAYIIFDDKAGVPSVYQGKYRLYQIPKSGTLNTQFSRNLGPFPVNEMRDWIKFYYKNEESKSVKRLPIFYLLTEEERMSMQDSIVVFYKINFHALTRDHEHVFRGIIIDTAKNINKYDSRRLLRVADSLGNRFIE